MKIIKYSKDLMIIKMTIVNEYLLEKDYILKVFTKSNSEENSEN